MLETKGGQITAFVIIAIVLVIGIGSLVYLARNQGTGISQLPGFAISASQAADSIKFERDSCIKRLTIEGIDLYGLNENSVTNHISSKLNNCISPVIENYRKQFTINASLDSIKVSISDAEISTVVKFPITVTKAEAIKKIDDYSLTFQRTITRGIEHDENCVLTRDAGLTSFDEKFEIFITRGIKAVNEDGSCLENISLRINDPLVDYGKRAGSLTSIDYVPLPFGAKFSDGVRLTLKYTQKDYVDYINSLIQEKSYPVIEKNLRIEYFDKENSNFYVYPAISPLQNKVDSTKKQIVAEVNQFYGSKLSLDGNCIADRESIVESADRRVQLIIFPETSATNGDGNCINKLEIQISPKSSKVVNFGNADYKLQPGGAVFSPYINYIYRYTTADINNPVFLYGYKNWQDLINDSWISPLNNTGSGITGQAISDTTGNPNIPARGASSLKIAYYDEADQVYHPWPTIVDGNNRRIIAQVGHFTEIIPAQACEDETEVTLPSIHSIAEPCQAGKSIESVTYTYSITVRDSCLKKANSIVIKEILSPGDSSSGFKADSSPKSGGHDIITGTLTDDGEISDMEGACAYQGVDIKARGLGVSAEDYNGVIMPGGTIGNTEGDCIDNGEGKFPCHLNPEECDNHFYDSQAECDDRCRGGVEVNCGDDGESSGEDDLAVEFSTSGEASSGVEGRGSWANSGGQIYGPENSSFNAVFDHQEADGTKGFGLLNTSIGIFATICDHKNGGGCWLMLNWQKIYHGNQESIGQGYDVENGEVIFPVEEPDGGVVYKNGVAKSTIYLRHSSAAAVYKGQPAFISSQEDGEYVLNAETGAKLKQLAVPARVGIPWDPAKIPGTDELFVPLVDNDGAETVVSTTNVVIGMPGATAVAAWKDKALASAKGIIYTIDFNNKTVTKYLDTGSEKVNQMWYDSSNDLLWVSCSSHDKLFYIDNQSNIYNVIELTDDSSSGGSLFDTRVTAGWWLRAKGQQGQWYRIEKKTA